jgi:hypothetical protein
LKKGGVFSLKPETRSIMVTQMNDSLYNTDQTFWMAKATEYRQRADGGPTLRILEGNLWGIPGNFHASARFESTEEGERVLLAAGFRFVPEEKGFRA